MGFSIQDNGGFPTIGTVSPKTKLHIYDMNNIEDVKAQIKLLEKKVALLEEIERIEKKKETQSLMDLIYNWWDDVFGNTDDTETSIDDLVTRIEEWLPKEQSAAGSQNVYVECTVEGFNDAIKKIKKKLR